MDSFTFSFTVSCPAFEVYHERGCFYYPMFSDYDVWCGWIVGVAKAP